MKHLSQELLVALALCAPLLVHAQVPVQANADHEQLLASTEPRLAANKRLVYDFWREVFEGGHMEFAEKYGLNMPIAREVDGVVNHGSTVEEAYRGLAAEKPGHEVHGYNRTREKATPLVAMGAAFRGGLLAETPQTNGITRLMAKTLRALSASMMGIP